MTRYQNVWKRRNLTVGNYEPQAPYTDNYTTHQPPDPTEGSTIGTDDSNPPNGWWVVFLTAVAIAIVVTGAIIISCHCK